MTASDHELRDIDLAGKRQTDIAWDGDGIWTEIGSEVSAVLQIHISTVTRRWRASAEWRQVSYSWVLLAVRVTDVNPPTLFLSKSTSLAIKDHWLDNSFFLHGLSVCRVGESSGRSVSQMQVFDSHLKKCFIHYFLFPSHPLLSLWSEPSSAYTRAHRWGPNPPPALSIILSSIPLFFLSFLSFFTTQSFFYAPKRFAAFSFSLSFSLTSLPAIAGTVYCPVGTPLKNTCGAMATYPLTRS